MRTSGDIPVAYLRQCFTLDADKGVLYWKERPRSHFSSDKGWRAFNSRYPGKEAASRTSRGYFSVGIKMKGKERVRHPAHHIVFAMYHGHWATMIDHINLNKLDNSVENLRETSPSSNQRNRKANKNSTTGRIGVFKHTKSGWESVITDNNHKVLRKWFSTFEDACAWRQKHEEEFGYRVGG